MGPLLVMSGGTQLSMDVVVGCHVAHLYGCVGDPCHHPMARIRDLELATYQIPSETHPVRSGWEKVAV